MNEARKRLHARCLELGCFPDDKQVEGESEVLKRLLEEWSRTLRDSDNEKATELRRNEGIHNEILRLKIIRDVAIKNYDQYIARCLPNGYWWYPVSLEELRDRISEEVYQKLKEKQNESR